MNQANKQDGEAKNQVRADAKQDGTDANQDRTDTTMNQSSTQKDRPSASATQTETGIVQNKPVQSISGFSALSWVYSFCKKYRLKLALIFVLVLGELCPLFFIPIIIRYVLDNISSRDFSAHQHTMVLYFFVVVTGISLMFAGNYLRSSLQTNLEQDMSLKVFSHINRLPLMRIQSNHSGDFIERVSTDCSQAASLIGGNIYDLYLNFVLCTASFFYLFFIDRWMAVVSLMLGPVSLIVGRFFDKRIRNISRQVNDSGGVVRGVLQEYIQAMPIVRVFRLQQKFNDKFLNERGEQISLMKKRVIFTNILWRTVAFINSITVIAFAYIVCINVTKGSMEIGNAMLFFMLAGAIQWPFMHISNDWGNIQQGLGAADRIFAVLQLQTEEEMDRSVAGKHSVEIILNHEPAIHEKMDDTIVLEVKDLSFCYVDADGMETRALDNISFQIGQKEMVAIVGPSGGGKSTIAKLCCGLYRANSGHIRVMGRFIHKDLQEARNLISYVSQHPYVFSGTIRENIVFGAQDISDEEILLAAKKANALEFIEKREGGLMSRINELGGDISGGQRQRLAIARAFLRNRKLMIFDEATSALDNQSEQFVQEAITNAAENAAVIVIAHRLSTVLKADRILVVDKGRIVEEGTHAELLARDGLYASMYNG